MKGRTSYLSLELRCPRCERAFEVADLTDFEQFRAFPVCGSRSCRQRWWAMILHQGAVEPQLAAVFGEEIAPDLMQQWKLPNTVRQQLFWHISISQTQYEEHGRSGSRSLLKFLASLVPLKAGT
jgi:hypothetical protein